MGIQAGRKERWILFPGAAPSAPVETRGMTGPPQKRKRSGPKRHRTHKAPPAYGEAERKAHFRFRQNAASRHVSDLSTQAKLGELHSDRLAGNFTLFRVPLGAAAAGVVFNSALIYHSFPDLSRTFCRIVPESSQPLVAAAYATNRLFHAKV